MIEHQLETITFEDILNKFGGRQRFEKYVELLLEENQRINLVSRETSPEDLYKLIADCLIPVYLEGTSEMFSSRTWIHLLDIGSGGGLPSLPLALALGNVELTLIERTGKKAMFLRRALKALGIKGRVLNCNFREFADNPQILTPTGEMPSGSVSQASGLKFDLITIRWVKADFPMIRRASTFVSEKDKQGGLIYYSPAGELEELKKGTIAVSSHPYTFAGDSQDNRTVTVFNHK